PIELLRGSKEGTRRCPRNTGVTNEENRNEATAGAGVHSRELSRARDARSYWRQMVGVRYPRTWRRWNTALQRVAQRSGGHQSAHVDGDAARDGTRRSGCAHGLSRGTAARGVRAHSTRRNPPSARARTGRVVRRSPPRGRRRSRRVRCAERTTPEIDTTRARRRANEARMTQMAWRARAIFGVAA